MRIGCSPRIATQLSVVLRWGWTDSQIFFFWTWHKYNNPWDVLLQNNFIGSPFLKNNSLLSRLDSGLWTKCNMVHGLSRLKIYVIFTSIIGQSILSLNFSWVSCDLRTRDPSSGIHNSSQKTSSDLSFQCKFPHQCRCVTWLRNDSNTDNKMCAILEEISL